MFAIHGGSPSGCLARDAFLPDRVAGRDGDSLLGPERVPGLLEAVDNFLAPAFLGDVSVTDRLPIRAPPAELE